MALEDYPFRVEQMSPRGEIGRVLAYPDHPIIARAAFRAAVEQYPKEHIRLRNLGAGHAGAQAEIKEAARNPSGPRGENDAQTPRAYALCKPRASPRPGVCF